MNEINPLNIRRDGPLGCHEDFTITYVRFTSTGKCENPGKTSEPIQESEGAGMSFQSFLFFFVLNRALSLIRLTLASRASKMCFMPKNFGIASIFSYLLTSGIRFILFSSFTFRCATATF